MASSRKIEERAILSLENIIARHPTMQGHINKCDKELCWDGYISIFIDDNDPGDKDNFDYRVPVQI